MLNDKTWLLLDRHCDQGADVAFFNIWCLCVHLWKCPVLSDYYIDASDIWKRHFGAFWSWTHLPNLLEALVRSCCCTIHQPHKLLSCWYMKPPQWFAIWLCGLTLNVWNYQFFFNTYLRKGAFQNFFKKIPLPLLQSFVGLLSGAAWCNLL